VAGWNKKLRGEAWNRLPAALANNAGR